MLLFAYSAHPFSRHLLWAPSGRKRWSDGSGAERKVCGQVGTSGHGFLAQGQHYRNWARKAEDSQGERVGPEGSEQRAHVEECKSKVKCACGSEQGYWA